MGSLTKKAAIVGVGETPHTRSSGVSDLALQLWACKLALEDAGLKPGDVDCLIPCVQGISPETIAANLGISDLKWNARSWSGGGEPSTAVAMAAMLFEAGLVTIVLAYTGYNGYSARRLGRGDAPGRIVDPIRRDFEHPFGYLVPGQWYAMLAQRHMFEYGTTSLHFAAYAVAARKHASLNPNALMRDPITIEDHQKSRMITHPYRLLDCSIESDGGAAFVVTTPDRARNLRHPPVHLLGIGSSYPPSPDNAIHRPVIHEFGTRAAAKRCFEMAGVEHKDIDVATLTDPFSFMAIRQMELLGFCKDGEGGPYISGGRIELGGELPVNTHGGVHSHAHCGYVPHLNEVVWQLRHEAGARQAKGAEVALVSGWGVDQLSVVSIFGRG